MKPCARCEILSADLALVKQERDALLANQWAGPWREDHGVCRRRDCGACVVVADCHEGPDGWRWWSQGAKSKCATKQEAKDACDVELRRMGWWLA